MVRKFNISLLTVSNGNHLTRTWLENGSPGLGDDPTIVDVSLICTNDTCACLAMGMTIAKYLQASTYACLAMDVTMVQYLQASHCDCLVIS